MCSVSKKKPILKFLAVDYIYRMDFWQAASLSTIKVKGVGPKLQKRFASAGIETIGDIIDILPARYEEVPRQTPIGNIKADGRYLVCGEIVGTSFFGRKFFRARLRDNTGTAEILFFWWAPYLSAIFGKGKNVCILGRAKIVRGKPSFAHPTLVSPEDRKAGLKPVYFLPHGLSSVGRKRFVSIVKSALALLPDDRFEFEGYRFSPKSAYLSAHFPGNLDEARGAMRALLSFEVLMNQIAFVIRRRRRSAIRLPVSVDELLRVAREVFPFRFTSEQRRVLGEFAWDVSSGCGMSRLLQGEVGSGKTACAVVLMLAFVERGYQVVFLVPTFVLAHQHYRNLVRILGNRASIALLTGATDPIERSRIMLGIASGDIDILVGTHAMFDERLEFSRLALLVIDEQQRFGVSQRMKLLSRMERGHLLMMTATPIPRTLALAYFGDLDVSTLRHRPNPVRVRTYVRDFSARERVFDYLEKRLEEGERLFIIHPVIQKTDEVSSLKEGIRRIRRRFPDVPSAEIHGKMPASERASVLDDFRSGKVRILVSTNIIEVGLDVHSANLMLIESAERFGLSQLHQMRGRIGRGGDEAICILLTDAPEGSEARERLEFLARSTDGFEISEFDMLSRGVGNIWGEEQSGRLGFDLLSHKQFSSLIQSGRELAEKLVERDPKFSLPQSRFIRSALLNRWRFPLDIAP